MTTIPQEAIDAAEQAAASRLDDLVDDIDAALAKDGTYDADDVRTALTVVAREALEAAAPVLRDHWQAGGALHELVFTDREARPAKWQARCGRTDVPVERTTSPDPAGYYQVDCPACLRVAELEARLAEVRRIAESLGDRSKPADYLPPFDPNQPAGERPLTDRRLMEPLKRMLLDVLDRP